jgi:hypothetical protein
MAVGQRIQKAAQRAAKQRTKRVKARQAGRSQRQAARQSGRSQRQARRQAGRTARTEAKSMGGKWSPGSTGARWSGAAGLAGALAPIAVTGLGGTPSSGDIPGPGEFGPYGIDPFQDPMMPSNGNGAGWWSQQTQTMQIGIIAAAGAGLWFLLRKK